MAHYWLIDRGLRKTAEEGDDNIGKTTRLMHLRLSIYNLRQIVVFMPFIGQFCRDVIGHQNLKVAVNGWVLFYCYFGSIDCLLRSVSFMSII